MIKAAPPSKNGKLQKEPNFLYPLTSLTQPTHFLMAPCLFFFFNFFPRSMPMSWPASGQQKKHLSFAIFTLNPVVTVTQSVRGEFVKSDVCGDCQRYPLGSNGRHYYIQLKPWSCGEHPRLFRNNCLASCAEEKPNLEG